MNETNTITVPQSRMDRGFEQYQAEYEEAALRVLRSGWYILGREVEQLEKDFASYIGTTYAVGVGNGLDALHLAFRALDIGAGDEVIVQGNTYIASVMGITMNGATPVFAEPDAYHLIDPDEIRKKITDKTKAVLVVHLYGQASRMEEIVAICKEHDLKLVEDCAQSHGAFCGDTMTGAFGDIGCFSFYPSKNMGAFGDAGACTTSDAALAQKLRVLRNYGSEKRYHNMVVGVNSRLDEMQAALLGVKLSHMDEITNERQRIAARYDEGIHNPHVEKPLRCDGVTHVFHQYVLRVPTPEGSRENARDAFQKYLESCGIGTIIHYPIPPHRSEAYAYLNMPEGSLPITERLATEVVSLPMFTGMTEEEEQQVIDSVNAWEGI